MRAELDASICAPQDQPVKLAIDPGDIDARLSGTPSVTASPVALGLPTITVTVPNITITPPTLTVSLDIGFGTNSLPDYLTSMLAVLSTLNPSTPPNPLDPDNVLWLAIVATALPLGAIKAIALPGLNVNASVVPGPIKVSFDKPFSVALGEFSLHGLPVAGANQPMTVGANLGNTGVAAKIEPTTATLSGCLVLNGGNPPCPPHPPTPSPPPVVTRVDKKRGDDKTGLIVSAYGQHFGSTQGLGSMVLKTTSATFTPVLYQGWTDSGVTAVFHPVPPNGAYVLVVTSAGGTLAQGIPFILP